MPRAQMQEIVDFAVRHNLYLISDEIYDRLTYDGTHTCVPALPGARERTILLERLLQSLCHDRLARRLCLRPARSPERDV